MFYSTGTETNRGKVGYMVNWSWMERDSLYIESSAKFFYFPSINQQTNQVRGNGRHFDHTSQKLAHATGPLPYEMILI